MVILLSPTLVAANQTNQDLLKSGPFYLADGTLPPKSNGSNFGILNIPLQQSLIMEMQYDITCDIENPNYNKPYPVVIKIFHGNINSVTSPSGQYLLDKQISKYKTRIVMIPQRLYLTFYNYDDTDSVFVRNCIAVYATN